MALALHKQLLQPLIVLDELGSREGGDGLFVQPALIALDDLLLDLVLLLIGLSEQLVGHILQILFSVLSFSHGFFPPYPFLNLYFSLAASNGSKPSSSDRRADSSRTMRI